MYGVEFNPNMDRSEMVIKPIGRFDRFSIHSIPEGAHVLSVTLEEDGVRFEAGVWTEETREAHLAGLPNEDDAYDASTIFYVDPALLKEAVASPANLPTPEEIADRRIAENYGTERALTLDINDGRLDADGVRAMLVQAVKDAREGLVQNPF